MSASHNNVKNFALNLLKQYFDPIVWRRAFKDHNEYDLVPRKVMLVDNFFSLRKIDNMIMDVHLKK
jgi:hypothetical protein